MTPLKWVIIGVLIFLLLIFCAVRCGNEYNKGPGKIIVEKQETAMEMAARMMNQNPTAAGKKEGKP